LQQVGLHVVDIDVEAFEAEIGEGVHFRCGGHGFLAGHNEERAAEFGQFFEEGAFLLECAEGGAGGAVIGVEVRLQREGAAV
jgi:hypothetical protein